MIYSNFPSSVTTSLATLSKLRQGIQTTQIPPHIIPNENNSSIDEIPFAADVDFADFLDAKSFNRIYSDLIALSDIISADLSGKLKL